MVGPGRIPGRYNIIAKGEYDPFDHRLPVADFIQQLENDDIPDKVSVIGLGDAFEEGELIDDLANAMDQRANDLEYQSPTIQFVVEGSFHRKGTTYDLRYNGELYPLHRVFGPQFERKEKGNWLVAPF